MAQPDFSGVKLKNKMISDASPVEWVAVCRAGRYRGYTDDSGKQVTSVVSKETFSQAIENFYNDKNARPVYFGHADAMPSMTGEEAPARGWVLGMYADESTGVLWAAVEMSPALAAGVKDGSFKYTSVYIDQAATHYKTGEDIGADLRSLAVTNQPFVRNLAPMSLAFGTVPNSTSIYLQTTDASQVPTVESAFSDFKEQLENIIMATTTTKMVTKEVTKDDSTPGASGVGAATKGADTSNASPAGKEAAATPAAKAPSASQESAKKADEQKMAETPAPADDAAPPKANAGEASPELMGQVLDELRKWTGNPDLSADEAMQLVLQWLAAEEQEEQVLEPGESQEGATGTGDGMMKASLFSKRVHSLKLTQKLLLKERDAMMAELAEIKKSLATKEKESLESIVMSEIKAGNLYPHEKAEYLDILKASRKQYDMIMTQRRKYPVVHPGKLDVKSLEETKNDVNMKATAEFDELNKTLRASALAAAKQQLKLQGGRESISKKVS